MKATSQEVNMLVEAKRVFALLAVTVLMVAVLAMPASAQQSGLVNVEVNNVNVQVPIAVAANVCGVDIDIIAEEFAGTDRTVCDADASAFGNNRQQSGR